MPQMFNVGYWAEEVSSEDPNGDIPVWNESPQDQPTMGKELNTTQLEQLRDLFKTLEDVLSSCPGRMEGVEHRKRLEQPTQCACLLTDSHMYIVRQ